MGENEVEKVCGTLENIDDVVRVKTGRYKLGLKIDGNWYGLFGDKTDMDKRHAEAVGAVFAEGLFKKSGNYRNLESVAFKKTLNDAKQENISNRCENMIQCLEDADSAWRTTFGIASFTQLDEADKLCIEKIAVHFSMNEK